MSHGVDGEAAFERFSLVTGGDRQTLADLESVAPDLGRYIVDFGYGEVYARPGLELRERQIAALAALVSQGAAEPQLILHVGGALRVGLSESEVIEVIVQCLPFVGFPRILNAVAAARGVFEEERGG